MKKILMAGAASVLMLTACKKTEPTVTEKSLEQEKIEFQARQLEIEKQKLAIEKEKIAFERAKDSLAKVNQGTDKSVAATPAKQSSSPRVVTKTRTVYRDAAPRRSSGSYASNSGSGSQGSYPVAQQPTRQRRFTHTQKATVVGTVTGAAAGAILNKKNRGAGAVIGGIVGGATGYGVGRAVDKKEGQQ